MINRTLGVLLSDIPTPPEHNWREYALKLYRPLLEDFLKKESQDLHQALETESQDHHLSERCFRFCLHLLEGVLGTPTDVQLKYIAALIRFNVRYPFPDPKNWFTQVHLDLLMDYHIRICQGSDYDAVEATFTVLVWLGGSPSTQDKKCRYIDTMIRFMGQKETCRSALLAACSVPNLKVLASMGSDDESELRERFSKALASAIVRSGSWDDTTLQTPADRNPFKDIKFFDWNRDVAYLRLLCALSQEPVWQLQLHHNGHFDNCLVIAETLSAHKDGDFGPHAVHVTHILANIDASGEEHPFYASVQAYPSWPLILQAWNFIFSINLRGAFVINWTIALTKHLEALPSLITYSRNRYEGKNPPLIILVEHAYQKLDEEEQQRERDKDQLEGLRPSSRQESRALAEEVMSLLESAQREV